MPQNNSALVSAIVL